MAPTKSKTFTKEADAIIDQYLKKVRSELEASGLTESETDVSIKELHAHIIEMCKLKTEEDVITTDVVEKTLKKLGTPEQITSVLKSPNNGKTKRTGIMETPQTIGRKSQPTRSLPVPSRSSQEIDVPVSEYLEFAGFLRGLILILSVLGILPRVILRMTIDSNSVNIIPLPEDRFVVPLFLGFIVAVLVSLYALTFIQVIGDDPSREIVGIRGIEADPRNLVSFVFWFFLFLDTLPSGFLGYIRSIFVIYNTLLLGIFSGAYLLSRIRPN